MIIGTLGRTVVDPYSAGKTVYRGCELGAQKVRQAVHNTPAWRCTAQDIHLQARWMGRDIKHSYKSALGSVRR